MQYHRKIANVRSSPVAYGRIGVNKYLWVNKYFLTKSIYLIYLLEL
jgi:hypothetical protein